MDACGPMLKEVLTSFKGQRQRGVDPTEKARACKVSGDRRAPVTVSIGLHFMTKIWLSCLELAWNLERLAKAKQKASWCSNHTRGFPCMNYTPFEDI